MARPRQPVPTGCLLVLAYLVACYSLAGWIALREPPDWGWLAAAPVTVPLSFAFGLLMIGNPELPVDQGDLMMKAGAFLVLFVGAMEVLRRLLGPNDRRR